ncbi:MAG: hypothetical protein U0414_30530 [Polyangiaceae bacterium]
MILLSFLSQSESARRTFSMCAGSFFLPKRPREKLTVAHTVSNASVESSCGTSPIFDRAARKSFTTSCPSATIVPRLIVTIPQTMWISVVLPAPFGPSRAKISPRSISRSTDFSATKPSLYVLPTPSMRRMGAMSARSAAAARSEHRPAGGRGRGGRER